MTQYASQTFYVPQICLQNITIEFAPAGQANAAVIQAFGGLSATPALVTLMPEIRLDGVLAERGLDAAAYGHQCGGAGAVLSSGLTREPAHVERGAQRHGGGNRGHRAGGAAIERQLVASRIDKMLGEMPTATPART